VPFRVSSMGNCLSSQGADDLSLLNESEGASLPGEPPPPYQVCLSVCVYVCETTTALSKRQTFSCSQYCVKPRLCGITVMYGKLVKSTDCDLDLQEQQVKFLSALVLRKAVGHTTVDMHL